LKGDITGIAGSSGIKTVLETLIKHSNAAKADEAAGDLIAQDPADTATDLHRALTLTGIAPAGYATILDSDVTALYADPATDADKNREAKKAIAAAYPSIISFFYSVQTAAATYEKTLDDSLAASLGAYKSILNKVAAAVSELPPSGAVAGVYAFVDNQRGVWKAPANVSLNAVTGPVTAIDNAMQDDMNVEVNAGKSINAIRAFTGKGTLVWGARTLAGNDNEWRYISVRRFFNMVEESVKKASGQFVFEPNDANTWIKVKGMIENYLTNLWRQGALAGAKAEHAFFVKIGLGQTMTAVDILEGRMIVEIGMAVVRPAEFIILKFSHKMQES
jgi:phage tail sheath protein FI